MCEVYTVFGKCQEWLITSLLGEDCEDLMSSWLRLTVGEGTVYL